MLRALGTPVAVVLDTYGALLLVLLPLTISTAQLVMPAVWLTTTAAGDPPGIRSWALLGALTAGSLLFALAWQRLLCRGPLERLLTSATTVRPGGPRSGA